MKNHWATHTLGTNNAILQMIGAPPGSYKIMWDTAASTLRIQDPGSGQQWQIPLASPSDVVALLSLSNKTRDNLSKGETNLLKQLNDARYNSWTRWKQSNYEVRTKTDSTGFVKDILIRRTGTTGDDDHIHIYTDSMTGEKGSHVAVTRNGQKRRFQLDPNKSIDDLINDFT